MHADRIDPALVGAATPPLDADGGARVVGLGAPVSVRIRLSPCETRRLRAQVLHLLEAARARTQTLADQQAAAPVVRAWETMLDQLRPRERPGELDVLWPTALAFPALRAAAEDALDALAHAPRGVGDLDALAHLAHETIAAIETLRAFVAVDHGGLHEVGL